MVLDRIVLVQIERRVSLLVLYYSNLHTQMPERAQVRVRVCVGVIARMVKAIRRCRRNAGNAGNGGALCDHLNVAACQKVLKDGGGADRGLHDPLPGVLDHTEFSRVTTDLRRCTLCGEGAGGVRL